MNSELLERFGYSVDEGHEEEPRARMSFSGGDVPAGKEFVRIANAPRRPAPDASSPEAEQLAEFLTQRLARVADPYPGRLRPLQALALKEAWEHRGGYFMLGTGVGKTLASFLLPVVLKAKRPLYVCPGSIEKDMRAEFAQLAKSWRSEVPIQTLSYEKLSQPASSVLLDRNGHVVRKSLVERIAPDLIVLDESHFAKASGRTRAKRTKAALKALPGTIVCALTGTPFISSITDAEHVMKWCLGENSPLPHEFLEREAWASYLDAKSNGVRMSVGALIEFADGAVSGEEETRTAVRQGLARRILETPGVIGSSEPVCDIPLTIEAWLPEAEDEAINDAFADLAAGALPDGTELADPMQLATAKRTVALGFWNKWVPAPPLEWREARKDWARWCRDAIQTNRRGIDSEAVMAAAVRSGAYDDEGRLDRWIAQRDAERARTGHQEPPSVAQWISDEALEEIARWVDEHPDGLVWVGSYGLGKRLEAELDLPYYRGKGMSDDGRNILHHPARTAAIASFAANGTGKNLQFQWSKNLWCVAPGEQQLARTHRPGQSASVVENWIYLGCTEHLKAFYAQRDVKARFAEEMTLASQKLNQAQTNLPKQRDLAARGGPRWEVASKTKKER